MIAYPGLSTAKPTIDLAIDPAHPWAQGLVGLYLLGAGAGMPRNEVSELPASSNNAPWIATTYGPALSFNGTTQLATLASEPTLKVTGPITLITCGSPATGTVNQHSLDVRIVSPTCGFYMAFDVNGNNEINFFLQTSAGASFNSASTAAAVDGGLHVFGATAAGTGANQVAFYRDGQPWGTATTSVLPSFAAGAFNARLGVNVSGNGAWFKGVLHWAGLWSGVLSPQVHAAIGASPRAIWSLFRSIELPAWSSGFPVTAPRVRRTLFARAGSRGAA